MLVDMAASMQTVCLSEEEEQETDCWLAELAGAFERLKKTERNRMSISNKYAVQVYESFRRSQTRYKHKGLSLFSLSVGCA